MQTIGSPASLVASIREDADAETERIREATAAELATIRADAGSPAAVEDRDQRLAAARRENGERIARQEWEGRRAAMQQRETWIQGVAAKAQESWSTTSGEALESLVREARARLPEGECEVVLSTRGGCVVRNGDVSFDNTFEARSRRLEPEWRNALSGMYQP